MERKSKYSEAYREKMPQVESIFMKKITQVHSGADSVKSQGSRVRKRTLRVRVLDSSMSFNRVEPRINSSLDEFVRVFV